MYCVLFINNLTFIFTLMMIMPKRYLGVSHKYIPFVSFRFLPLFKRKLNSHNIYTRRFTSNKKININLFHCFIDDLHKQRL